MTRLAVALAFAAALPAQTIRLANYSTLPAPGWVRTTVDKLPTPSTGRVGDATYVVGRRIGLDTWAVDVRADLAPGEQRTIDLATATAATVAVPSLPADPWSHFGGAPMVNGAPLQLDAIAVDGVAWSAHLAVRVSPMLHVQIWMLWRGDEPYLVTGEAVATASNPSVPDLVAGGSGPLQLRWGDALVHVAGAGWGAPIVPAGADMANAQARAVPFVAVWPRHLRARADYLVALAAVNRTTCAVGVAQLLPDGNPTLPAGFDARVWTLERYAESLRRLHTWDGPVCGPAPISSVTGAQEDQVFVRGECFASGGLGAEQVAYFSALKMFARPCHHLEVDGRIVDPTTAAPRLIYWDGLPHWHTGVSPNRLGKPSFPTVEQTHGWAGPDVEHWLMNTTAAAARLTGSHALQWDLRHQANVYLGQWTTTPGWSTTQPYASRAVGWEGINAVHLWRGLEDRALAERVRAHWLKRCTDVILPAWRDRDVVDVRWDDPRLGAGAWWICWQQATGAYGLDLACAQIGPPEGRDVALRLARTVLDRGWVLVGDRWQSRAQAPVDGTAPSDESFNGYGLPLAVAVVLRHEPDNQRALAIWGQVRQGSSTSWLAPGVVTQ